MPTLGAARPPEADPIEWIAARIPEPRMDRMVARHDPERRADGLQRQIDELTAALRYWESQAAILFENADASARIRYMTGRINHAARRRLESVVRWLLRSDSRTG
jgi:hypothetical protein